jgi:hypothetical protein
MAIGCNEAIVFIFRFFVRNLSDILNSSTPLLFRILAYIQYRIDLRNGVARGGSFVFSSQPGRRWLSLGNPSQHNRDLPKWKFFIIGFFLCLGEFLLFIGSRGTFVTGPVVVLMQQAVIPWTMIGSMIFLKRR